MRNWCLCWTESKRIERIGNRSPILIISVCRSRRKRHKSKRGSRNNNRSGMDKLAPQWKREGNWILNLAAKSFKKQRHFCLRDDVDKKKWIKKKKTQTNQSIITGTTGIGDNLSFRTRRVKCTYVLVSLLPAGTMIPLRRQGRSDELFNFFFVFFVPIIEKGHGLWHYAQKYTDIYIQGIFKSHIRHLLRAVTRQKKKRNGRGTRPHIAIHHRFIKLLLSLLEFLFPILK